MVAGKRLDEVLVEKGLVENRSKARALILAGKVRLDGEFAQKAGQVVSGLSNIELIEGNRFVGRGGLKLEGALNYFDLQAWINEITDPIALDIGASTGGFTDCLLQNGIKRVHAIDVGYGQLDWKLRNDPRVKVYEQVNIRYLEPKTLGEKVHLITIDVSFISILKFLKRLPTFLEKNGKILALVKPQFEAKPKEVGKGGVIRDPEIQQEVFQRFLTEAKKQGFEFLGEYPSPVLGAKGNQEIFCLLILKD